MSKTMSDRIIELHTLMTPIVIDAGIGPVLWAKVAHNPQKWVERRQCFIIEFLEKLYRDEWKKIDHHLTQFCATNDMWENMVDLFDEEDFPEIVKLRNLQKNLKQRWIKFKDEYRDLLADLRS